MSTTQTPEKQPAAIPTAARVDTKLEVVVIPVSDVDRAKRFYESLGWRLDADFTFSEDHRVMQLTPPGSPCSILFGEGVTDAIPGSSEGFLVVDNLDTARADLLRRGIDVSEPFHEGFHPAGKGRVPGRDPQGRSYLTFASFRDPDGNEWLLQEVTTRLPGRVQTYDGLSDASTLTELLRETKERHSKYEPTAPKHHWSTWYAAYIVAREHGKTPDEAARDAARHVERH